MFADYLDPTPVLQSVFGIDIVDDSWFHSAAATAEIHETVGILQHLYESRCGREKSNRPATHDALLLRWIHRQRIQGAARVWAVTLDQSLPLYRYSEGSGPMRSLALSLDALVQWISPALLATGDREEEGLAHVFSEAVRHSLLPQDTLFDVNDFLVFAEMEWSCKELPADDVEGCVRYLQDFAPELDPLNPRHRELIQLRMSKFFADPGRKYKQELARTEKELKLTRRTADKQL